jgi:hypothetical protein
MHKRLLLTLAGLLVLPAALLFAQGAGPLAEGGNSARSLLPPPTLTGHLPGGGGTVLPYDVQAAFNEDTFFWRLTYRGNEGKRHGYYRFTGGKWVKEGGDRRDAQATIDKDEHQGATNVKSTVYEQRTSIMVNDPSRPNAVKNFDKFGCFITCHNMSRHGPEWTHEAGEDTKFVEPAMVKDGAKSSDKVLDLWHWRGARSNPIWKADDQWIKALNFANKSKDDEGGRKGDGGKGVFRTQPLKDGHPEVVFDPSTTWGRFAFKWDAFWLTPFYYIVEPDAAGLGATAPNPVALAWDEAVKRGYTPQEGDTVPRRVLRAGEGSRADITAYGSRFEPTTLDGSLGVWRVQMQRKLDTGHDDDIALKPGKSYDVGFEVHLWEYTTRDHYVSFPQKLSLGAKGKADIQAVKILGKGTFPLPDWDNTARFPVTRLYLFQPGISTWEFVTGKNDADGKVYVDPVTGKPVDQSHPGDEEVRDGSKGCAECHTVRAVEPPTAEEGGPMELLAPQRGGTWAPTPVLKK